MKQYYKECLIQAQETALKLRRDLSAYIAFGWDTAVLYDLMRHNNAEIDEYTRLYENAR